MGSINLNPKIELKGSSPYSIRQISSAAPPWSGGSNYWPSYFRKYSITGQSGSNLSLFKLNTGFFSNGNATAPSVWWKDTSRTEYQGFTRFASDTLGNDYVVFYPNSARTTFYIYKLNSSGYPEYNRTITFPVGASDNSGSPINANMYEPVVTNIGDFIYFYGQTTGRIYRVNLTSGEILYLTTSTIAATSGSLSLIHSASACHMRTFLIGSDVWFTLSCTGGNTLNAYAFKLDSAFTTCTAYRVLNQAGTVKTDHSSCGIVPEGNSIIFYTYMSAYPAGAYRAKWNPTADAGSVGAFVWEDTDPNAPPKFYPYGLESISYGNPIIKMSNGHYYMLGTRYLYDLTNKDFLITCDSRSYPTYPYIVPSFGCSCFLTNIDLEAFTTNATLRRDGTWVLSLEDSNIDVSVYDDGTLPVKIQPSNQNMQSVYISNSNTPAIATGNNTIGSVKLPYYSGTIDTTSGGGVQILDTVRAKQYERYYDAFKLASVMSYSGNASYPQRTLIYDSVNDVFWSTFSKGNGANGLGTTQFIFKHDPNSTNPISVMYDTGIPYSSLMVSGLVDSEDSNILYIWTSDTKIWKVNTTTSTSTSISTIGTPSDGSMFGGLVQTASYIYFSSGSNIYQVAKSGISGSQVAVSVNAGSGQNVSGSVFKYYDGAATNVYYFNKSGTTLYLYKITDEVNRTVSQISSVANWGLSSIAWCGFWNNIGIFVNTQNTQDPFFLFGVKMPTNIDQTISHSFTITMGRSGSESISDNQTGVVWKDHFIRLGNSGGLYIVDLKTKQAIVSMIVPNEFYNTAFLNNSANTGQYALHPEKLPIYEALLCNSHNHNSNYNSWWIFPEKLIYPTDKYGPDIYHVSKAQQVTITTTPSRIKLKVFDYKRMIITNTSNIETLYVGDSSVSTTNYIFKIPPNGTLDEKITSFNDWFIRSGSASVSDVNIVQMR